MTYEIDAMRRRVGRSVDGELTARWLYRDALHPAAELDGFGNIVATFIYAEEANVPAYLVKNGVNYRGFEFTPSTTSDRGSTGSLLPSGAPSQAADALRSDRQSQLPAASPK